MSETTTTTPQSILDMTYEQYHGTKGSWIPTIIIISILLIRYLLSKSIKFQRFVSTTKISIKKKLGYRDDTKYKMGVGFNPISIILQPDLVKPDIVCFFKSGLDNLPSILIRIFVSLLRFFSLQINPKK